MLELSEGSPLPGLGLIGFGAFGRLMARHLAPHFRLLVHDVAPGLAPEPGVTFTGLATAARCRIVVLAVPVDRLGEAIAALRPHLRPGTVVVDVGSVKVVPARIMLEALPPDVDIVGTHPLFGPQSARAGIAGLKLALCQVRGRSAFRVAAFLRRHLRLRVILTTPEKHDREMAVAQGLTHLIAAVLVRMEPLPTHMTTRSFDLLMQAVEMVRHDAPGVFEAIERGNPYAAAVRDRFLGLTAGLRETLDHPAG
ncbi:prephenate dehydrogenase/arogenate dehydrogenase family protein [Falsiroseomonas sp. HC035]|uniref:prephenate dehydrogenase/arogenate dehydrogenase family protein n=1 Tax=Falsiroseomonas sp. HC035 TaxID=3390999 RepID=UPI003D318DB1